MSLCQELHPYIAGTAWQAAKAPWFGESECFLPNSPAYKIYLAYLALCVTLTSFSQCHLFYLLCSAVSPMPKAAPVTPHPTGERQQGTEPHRGVHSPTMELDSAPIREHKIRPLCLQFLCFLSAKIIGTCF